MAGRQAGVADALRCLGCTELSEGQVREVAWTLQNAEDDFESLAWDGRPALGRLARSRSRSSTGEA